MATDSSTLAWRIPWTEEPGGLQSMELQGVEHNSGTSRLLQNDGYVYKYLFLFGTSLSFHVQF